MLAILAIKWYSISVLYQLKYAAAKVKILAHYCSVIITMIKNLLDQFQNEADKRCEQMPGLFLNIVPFENVSNKNFNKQVQKFVI